MYYFKIYRYFLVQHRYKRKKKKGRALEKGDLMHVRDILDKERHHINIDK